MDRSASIEQQRDETKQEVIVKNEPVPDSILDEALLPTTARTTGKRSIKVEVMDGIIPRKRPKMEFLGVILPTRKQSGSTVMRTPKQQSPNDSFQIRASISPGPGDTDSKSGFGDEKPAVAPAPATMMLDEKHFKAKVKKDMELDDETIQKRIDRIGCPTIEVTLDIKLHTISRKFLSMTYGGSPQEVFPKIGAANLARHNKKHWMLFSPLLHPHAPQLPGEPGVWYDSCPFSPDDQFDEVHHTFVRIESGKWRYLGEYRCYVAEALTQLEWLFQSKEVRRAWGTILQRVPWGRRVRAMIKLRKQLRREADQTEIMKALKTSDKFADVTAEEIEKAYDEGKQRLGIMVLKCVNYDEEFQDELVQKFSVWAPPPPKTKRATKGTRKSKGKGKIKKEMEDSEAEVEVEEAEEVEGQVMEEEAIDLQFQSEVIVRRGTRTRPMHA